MALACVLSLAACREAWRSPVPPAPPGDPPGIRVYDLLHERSGSQVRVDIYEPLLEDETSRGREYRVLYGPPVWIVGGARELPPGLRAPVRVEGELAREIQPGREVLRLVPRSLHALPPMATEHVTIAQIEAHPERFSGKVVEIEDEYVRGFEVDTK